MPFESTLDLVPDQILNRHWNPDPKVTSNSDPDL